MPRIEIFHWTSIQDSKQEEEIPNENFCKLSVSQFSKYKQQKKVLRLNIQQVEKGLQFTEEE